jgi:ethanolamine utilization protein EutA
VLFRSQILLTPYVSATLIDTEKLQEFIAGAYRAAGMTPEEIDTGAVVITGEALKKENARPILEMFSKQVGKFICASAGPNHEALLAAYGSGSVALSRDHGWRVLNIDMGGGTTKLSIIEDGQVLSTAAINIGARLIAFDAEDRLTRIEEPARLILGDASRALVLGEKVSAETKTRLTEKMLDCLMELIEGGPRSRRTDELLITEPLAGYDGLAGVDKIVFSGGVSEYVYGRDAAAYGDLGRLLGSGVRARLEAIGHGGLIAESDSGIRATVIGAGEYTIQASGNTSYISNKECLPTYSLKVVKAESSTGISLEQAIRIALRKYDLEAFEDGLALALTLDSLRDLTYPFLREVAEGVADTAATADGNLTSLFLILDRDVAKSVGGILKEELGLRAELIALDGIAVGDLDFIDIGEPMGASEVLPVTVRSFVFPKGIKI